MTRRGRPRPGLPRRASAGSPTRSPRRTPTTSTARRASRPRRSTRCASERRAVARSCPTELGGGGVVVRGASPRPASSSAAAAAPARWSSPCTRSRSPRIVRHLDGAPWFEDYLRDARRRAAPDRLGHLRGRHRRRHGPLDRRGRRPATTARARFEKQAPTVSYGAHADDLLTTAAPRARRRARRPGRRAHPPRPARRSSRPGTWDPLGMRGTCSPGFVVRAEFAPEQVLADAVPDASRPSRWSRSRTSCGRTCGSASPPTPSTAPARSCAPRPSAARRSRRRRRTRLSHLMSELSLLRAEVGSALREFVEASDEPGRERLSTMAAVAALQQPQDRRLRAGAAGLPGRDGRLRDRRASRTTRRSASAATCATRCRPA